MLTERGTLIKMLVSGSCADLVILFYLYAGLTTAVNAGYEV